MQVNHRRLYFMESAIHALTSSVLIECLAILSLRGFLSSVKPVTDLDSLLYVGPGTFKFLLYDVQKGSYSKFHT